MNEKQSMRITDIGDSSQYSEQKVPHNTRVQKLDPKFRKELLESLEKLDSELKRKKAFRKYMTSFKRNVAGLQENTSGIINGAEILLQEDFKKILDFQYEKEYGVYKAILTHSIAQKQKLNAIEFFWIRWFQGNVVNLEKHNKQLENRCGDLERENIILRTLITEARNLRSIWTANSERNVVAHGVFNRPIEQRNNPIIETYESDSDSTPGIEEHGYFSEP